MVNVQSTHIVVSADIGWVAIGYGASASRQRLGRVLKVFRRWIAIYFAIVLAVTGLWAYSFKALDTLHCKPSMVSVLGAVIG